MALPDTLDREPFAVLDGGLSTALEQLGHRSTGELWTAALVLDRPDVVIAAHRLAVEAGADVVITSSYQASEEGFVRAGATPAAARDALARTTALAREAGAPAVAASIGPFGATLADGSEYHGRYAQPWDEVAAFHRRRLEVLVDTGPDVLAVETIPSRVEAEIVVDAVRSLTDLPMWVSYSCRGSATCAGDPFDEAVAAVADPQVVAVGANCTAPGEIAALLASTDDPRPRVVYPNHGGAWDALGECWRDPATGARLADHVGEWVSLGARLIGGCCGVAPGEIAELARRRDVR